MEHSDQHLSFPEHEYNLSPSEQIGVARVLTENAKILELQALQDGQTLLGEDFFKKLYDLLSPRLSDLEIQSRLQWGTAEDIEHMFTVLDSELRTWQRWGVVESQVMPLADYTNWLLDLHQNEDVQELVQTLGSDQAARFERRLWFAVAQRDETLK